MSSIVYISRCIPGISLINPPDIRIASSSMAQQKALLLTKAKDTFVVDTIPVPRPGPGEVLIKVQAAALNPVDWKMQAYDFFITKFPAVLGYDMSGTVEELGEGVTGFVKGDRV